MNKEKLIEAGIDYDEGVDRFAGNPEIFEKFLFKFFSGDLMAELEKKLACGDFDGAFRAAHNLKGTSGNLSVNAFYSKICELVELLRNNAAPDYENVFAQAKKLYDLAENAAREELL